jgi:hypothetical protein
MMHKIRPHISIPRISTNTGIKNILKNNTNLGSIGPPGTM